GVREEHVPFVLRETAGDGYGWVPRRLALDPLRVLLRPACRLASLMRSGLQHLALDASKLRGVTELLTELPHLVRPRQHLPSRGLPLWVTVLNDRTERNVLADGGGQIDSAERTDAVVVPNQIGPHLIQPIRSVAQSADRHLMIPTDADES